MSLFQAFSSYNSDEISTICPVRNTMWIGTAKGILKLKHAPTLTTKFKGYLRTDGLQPPFILNIVHIAEKSSVLVSTDKGEVWAFEDKLTPKGLVIQERLRLPDQTNCYQMMAVNIRGSLEVWGTMDKSQLLMLSQKMGGWTMEIFPVSCETESIRSWQFFHIAHATFEDQHKVTQDHLWVPYWKKSYTVCWDLQKREPRGGLDTTALSPPGMIFHMYELSSHVQYHKKKNVQNSEQFVQCFSLQQQNTAQFSHTTYLYMLCTYIPISLSLSFVYCVIVFYVYIGAPTCSLQMT